MDVKIGYPKYAPTWPGRVRDMKVCMAWQAWAYAMAAAWDIIVIKIKHN